MIDIESSVFNYVATKLRNAVEGITVADEYQRFPKKFPFTSIEEKNNSVVPSRRTTKIENMVSVMYEITVYSNKDSGKKKEAKRIMALADSYMEELGFTRTFMNPIPNLEDATVYRLVARYEAEVDETITTVEGEEHIECMVYQN